MRKPFSNPISYLLIVDWFYGWFFYCYLFKTFTTSLSLTKTRMFRKAVLGDLNKSADVILTDPDGREYLLPALYTTDGNGDPVLYY